MDNPPTDNYWMLLSRFADIVSIVGLVLTIWVTRTVSGIRRQYASIGRLPELIKSLQSHSTNLSKLFDEYERNKHQIELLVTQIGPILGNAKSKIDGDAKDRTTSLIKVIKKLKKTPVGKDDHWEVYGDLLGVIEGMEQFQRDQQWR